KEYGPRYPNTLKIEEGGDRRWSATLNILSGHIGDIRSVAWSADGRRIVSGSHDKTVRIWDVDTGQQHGSSLEGHNGYVQSVAFSPDGQRVASGSSDKTVPIWDVDAGQQYGPSLEGHDGRVRSVAFSPDGRQIVSGSDDNTVRIWDVETGQQRGSSLEGHDGWVWSVAFSPDGRQIVSASYDKTVRVWNVQQHAPLLEMSFKKPSSYRNASRMTDGWIRGANSERLFWVAPRLQMGLFPPFQTLFIGQYIQTRLDMSKFVHGAAWTQVRGDRAEASA
ncbi:POC1 centriolar protein A, partial [Serendipita sp. 407]